MIIEEKPADDNNKSALIRFIYLSVDFLGGFLLFETLERPVVQKE